MGQQFKMLKQLQQMQAKMAKIQEELGEKTVTGTAGGGMVEVVANGHQKVLSVTVRFARPLRLLTAPPCASPAPPRSTL